MAEPVTERNTSAAWEQKCTSFPQSLRGTYQQLLQPAVHLPASPHGQLAVHLHVDWLVCRASYVGAISEQEHPTLPMLLYCIRSQRLHVISWTEAVMNDDASGLELQHLRMRNYLKLSMLCIWQEQAPADLESSGRASAQSAVHH